MTSRRLAGSLFLGFAALSPWGCSSPRVQGPEQTPVRWIVVEKRMGDVTTGGWVGDGQVYPQALVLTMQPLYREDLEWEVVVDPHDYFVEVLEISPRAQASPGELVTAKVRVARARKDDVYRLVVKASQAEVEIFGAREQIVLGDAPAVFRFTSITTGRAGIAVGVERMEPGVPGTP